MTKKVLIFSFFVLVMFAFAAPSYAESHHNSKGTSAKKKSTTKSKRSAATPVKSTSKHKRSNADKRSTPSRRQPSRYTGSSRGSRGSSHHTPSRRKRTERRWIAPRFIYEYKYVTHHGYWVEEIIEAVYEDRVVIVTDPSTGESWRETRSVCVSPERVEKRWVPGWVEKVRVRIIIPGKWITVVIG